MSAVYPTARENFLTWLLSGAGAPVGAANICVIGVKDTYVYSAAHAVLAAVAGVDIVIPEVVLTGVTLTGGVIDAADLALTGVTPGPTLDAYVVYAKWAAATQLLFYIDTATDSTLPQILTTAKLNVEWSASGIGKI